jgi:hypothetical protein
MSLFRLVDSKFNQIFKMPQFDWCELMNGKKGFGLGKSLADTFREMLPELVQPCPYLGHYEKFNGKVSRQSFIFFPIGTYRLITESFVNGKLLVNTSLHYELHDN